MAFALPVNVGDIIDFIFQNIWIIVAISIAVIYLKDLVKWKTKIKPLNRAEIERQKFIERMKANPANRFIMLSKGGHKLGIVTHFKEFYYPEIKAENVVKKGKVVDVKKIETGKNKKIVQILVSPLLFGKIPNPFAKTQCYQIGENSMKRSLIEWNIKSWIGMDYIFGVYYDENTIENTDIIKNDNIMRTDLNQIASIYYVKSQEQSTFDPAYAHQMALKEKELQIELARKKGKAETI